MLIPHLHFAGSCAAAIVLYEKAFGTKVHVHDISDKSFISHAEMDIHGQKVFLNDRFGNTGHSTDQAIHMILMFKTSSELRKCWEVLAEGGTIIDPLTATPYSELVGNLMDRYGIMWGFMAE